MKEKRIVIAADDGYAETKIVCLEPGLRTQFHMPSCARSGAHGAMSVMDGPAVHPCYNTDGVQYTVGDNLHNAETARFDEYPFSGMNRAIVHHALRMAAQREPGLLGNPVTLVTGLPIFSFYAQGKPDQDTIARKTASLLKPITSTDGSALLNVVEHKVFPEGLAAWIDYAVDDQIRLRPEVNSQTIGVIDIGGRTTDVAVVLPGQCIDHARTTSIEVGVQDVAGVLGPMLADRFSRQYRNRVVMTPRMIAAAMGGSVRVFGRTEEVKAEAHAAIEEIMQRMVREINRNLGSASDLDSILLVGGGAHLFAALAERLPNIVIPQAPDFANARGFAKYAML